MMDTRHLLDPELRPAIELLPPLKLSAESVPLIREAGRQQAASLRQATPPSLTVSTRDEQVPGSPPVRVRIYSPRGAPAAVPALLWIHGGGYIAGSPESDDVACEALVDVLGCVVVSVDYRLAPETLHPGPVEDCHAALLWLHTHAEALGVDAQRIGIAGVSAGAGLCAALGLLARDRGLVWPCFQGLLQPMLDDRTATRPVDPHSPVGEFVWTADSNHFGWSALLGHAPGADGVSPYASPARAESLADLPPTYLATGALDLFLDEDLAYARRLMHAGVPTELRVYPGACHGFHVLSPMARLSQAWHQDWLAALRRGLGLDVATPPAPNEALIAQFAALLPGMPEADRRTFALCVGQPEPYALGANSLPREGVPRGSVRSARCEPGTVYPGVAHDYSVYVPAGLDASQATALMVFMDGARYLGPEIQVPVVLDNLIHEGSLPPIVAVFVQPGASGPGLPVYGGIDNRSIEYDSTGDAYARFLLDELLPEATRGLAISGDPARRAICGLSSGGHCALNAAWRRPDAFGKVVSHCGSFVNIRGGHQLASAMRASPRQDPRKGLRVFLQSGTNDLDILFGNWERANREMAAALAYQGYEHRLVIGRGGHSLVHGGALFPDTMRWLWSDVMERTQ